MGYPQALDDRMPHFQLEQWADFVRGVMATADSTAMREHLAFGCAECGRSFALFQQVAAIGYAESGYQVPKASVRRAKAIASPPAKTGSELRAVLSHLLYDSFRDPLPAGLRCVDRACRQVLYQAGEYSVDLCLESGPGRLRLNLVGQVANARKPNEDMEALPVLLFSGDRVIASDRSNAFGEFHLESRDGSHLRLCVLLFSAGSRIELWLPPERYGGLL